MRLPITLRDQSATLKVTLWSSEFANIIDYNCEELSVLLAACEGGAEKKQEFLDALNTNANAARRWILRPKEWEGRVQWNVAKVSMP